MTALTALLWLLLVCFAALFVLIFAGSPDDHDDVEVLFAGVLLAIMVPLVMVITALSWAAA